MPLPHHPMQTRIPSLTCSQVIFTQLIGRIKPRSDNATQTLILAHRRELVEQAARHCSNTYPDKIIDIEMGKLHASGVADITVASLQSITSGDRLLKFDPNNFKLVLVDEAHHIVAPGYLKVLEHFGLRHKQPDSPHLVGVSATFSRFDGLRLGAAIDEIVYHKDYVDMIGAGHLSDVLFTTVKSSANLSKVKRGVSGDFDTGALSKAVNTDQVNEVAIRAWQTKAAGRRSTLVFCVDLAHVAAMTQRFRHYGVDARFVTGDTPVRERAERLDAFRRGEFPVLVNCGVFTEGTDIPNIDCVLLARPTKSRNLLIQMIGRGMRLHPGKKDCQIIDMVSSLDTGIICTPSLFGLDPDELVEDASVDSMRELKERRDAEKVRLMQSESGIADSAKIAGSRAVTFTDYNSVLDLVADTSGEKHIRAISQLSWVQTDKDRYILEAPAGFIKLEKESREDKPGDGPLFWKAWEVKALPSSLKSKSPFASPRLILMTADFAHAVHGCDNFAGEKFPFQYVNRRMAWRNRPATEGQLRFLNKMKKSGEELKEDDITKGQAADMIVKIKHGARGRFADMEADKKRRSKTEHMLMRELKQAKKLRQTVSVGPVLN